MFDGLKPGRFFPRKTPSEPDRPLPPWPEGRIIRDLTGSGWHVRLDLGPQVLSLEIPEEKTWHRGEEVLEPTCPNDGDFVSASMLAVKAKLFDDGLMAAVEVAAQPGKARLLSALASVSPSIAAAARLGGANLQLSAEAQQLTDTFLANPRASKPLGFYTWSPELRRIFQQDRLLQQELTAAEAAAVAAVLAANPSLDAAYRAHLAMISRLTNPLMPGSAFFPASRSHESDLVMRLYGNTPIPDGFSLASEMVTRLRDGSLSVAPTSESGWYDLQTWALEPLACPDRVPEATRLVMDAGYRAQLEDLFKAVLALTRETHVKQLYFPDCGAALGARPTEIIVHVAPELTVEPLPTYYERRARGYEFVREILEGWGSLKTMNRVTAGGAVPRSLQDELSEMTQIFRGAAAVSRQELGLARAEESEARAFREWAGSPDVGEDVRMMVPVFYDIGRGQTKVWAILGWSTRLMHVWFDTRPEAQVVEGDVRIQFQPTVRMIAYPVFAEAYVSRLLDRDEFRAHCDRYKTSGEILRNL